MSLYQWLVPHVVSGVAERFGGRRMWSEARRLSELQWRPPSEVERDVSERLRLLVVHASAHVPHYRDLFRRSGLSPDDVRTRADLSRLPITTKAELRAGFPARTTADNLPQDRRRAMMTSGSTGLPFEFYWDRSCADELAGAYLFSLEWAGAAIWDTRIAVIVPSSFGTNVDSSSRFRQLGRRFLIGEHTVRLPAPELTTAKLRTLVAKLGRGRRYFIRGYPSAIARLAEQLLEESLTLPSLPKAVITYAETLTPVNAARIHQAFRCRVVNYYTSWDVPHIAQTCPDNPLLLHVNSDRVIVRVVRPDGADAAPGEPGDVVVTDLANHVMPFINYHIGDYAVAGSPCACGRGFPTLGSLQGRETEILQTPSGKQISGVVLGHFLAFVAGIVPYVWEYQAVQTAPNVVTLRVVPTARFTREFAQTLEHDIERLLDDDVSVAIEVVDRIPIEPSGKRFIIRSGLSGAGTGGRLTPIGTADRRAP